MEAGNGDGVEEESKRDGKSLRRPPSVDDLFAPMFRLDVHSSRVALSSGAAAAAAGRDGGEGSAARPEFVAAGRKEVFASAALKEEVGREGARQSYAADAQPPFAGGVEGSGNKKYAKSSGDAETQTPVNGTKDALFSSRWSIAVEKGVSDASKERFGEVERPVSGTVTESSTGLSGEVDNGSLSPDVKPGVTSSGTADPAIGLDGFSSLGAKEAASSFTNSEAGGQSNSTSDDDQLIVDERKQKRMLSNRESARRSRLRKQQHLDELRAHVAHLRAENNHMLNRFGLASQQYAQLTDENRVLRSHAMDLSRQLQRLHHTAAARHPGGLQALGLGSGHLDPSSSPLTLTLRSGRSDGDGWATSSLPASYP